MCESGGPIVVAVWPGRTVENDASIPCALRRASAWLVPDQPRAGWSAFPRGISCMGIVRQAGTGIAWKVFREVAHMEIHLWWLNMELPAKQWLREHPEAAAVPGSVADAVVAAGGSMAGETLTQREWDFIVTQSEFVD